MVERRIIGAFFGAWIERDPKGYAQLVAEMGSLLCQGMLRPHVSARYALARTGDALEALSKRKALGKLLVIPGLVDESGNIGREINPSQGAAKA